MSFYLAQTMLLCQLIHCLCFVFHTMPHDTLSVPDMLYHQLCSQRLQNQHPAQMCTICVTNELHTTKQRQLYFHQNILIVRLRVYALCSTDILTADLLYENATTSQKP